MNDLTPKSMGDYAVLGVLGAGGMGRVYKVRNIITDRVEAMKVLLPDLEGHEEVAARFLREIKLLAALQHPNIASLHTAVTINNQLVMIMEYVEGRSISSRLSEGAIPVNEALIYIEQILDALGYAHQHKVIHRDIKPANMMLTPTGIVKLMDFGIARTDGEPAKLTVTGTTLGSIAYMSPEQVKGAAIDERSDLYSVGISLYEMITGVKPFQGDSNFSIMAAHINQAPTPPLDLLPHLPEGLNEIILTSIAKEPEERFQSASAFRNAVRTVLRSLQDANTVFQSSQQTITGSAMSAATAATAGRATTPTPVARTPVPARPAAAAPQAAQPQATQVSPPPASGSSQRGLYMALGAIIVVIGLIAAGIFIPKMGKSSVAAGEETTAAIIQPAAVQNTQPAPVDSQPAESLPAQSQPVESAQLVPSKTAAVITAPVKAAAAQLQAASPPPASSAQAEAARQQAANAAAELDEIERQIDGLSGRAAAVNSSLEQLQRRQAAEGYGLRGDIVSRQASLNNNLQKAQNAVQYNDPVRAKRYADSAAGDLQVLEKFLGR